VQDWKSSYANVHRVDCNYEVGDQIFLWVKSHQCSIKFRKGAKISPRFLGPFEVVERKGPVAYQLDFPHSWRSIHNVYLVSFLRHYVNDPTHEIDMSSLRCWMRMHS
jgi:hypothetical protein